jgi:hypothetical protein
LPTPDYRAHAGVLADLVLSTRHMTRFRCSNSDCEPLLGTLSRSEVARLALLSDDGFEQESIELAEAPRKLRNRFGTERPYCQAYRLVRTALVRLLSEHELSLPEKLFVALWLAMSSTTCSRRRHVDGEPVRVRLRPGRARREFALSAAHATVGLHGLTC